MRIAQILSIQSFPCPISDLPHLTGHLHKRHSLLLQMPSLSIVVTPDKNSKSLGRELNPRPRPYQGRAIPLSHRGTMLLDCGRIDYEDFGSVVRLGL